MSQPPSAEPKLQSGFFGASLANSALSPDVMIAPSGSEVERTARRRMQLLQRLSADLTPVLTREAVADVVMRQLAAGLSAAAGGVFELSDDGREYAMIASLGTSDESKHRFARVSVDAPLPLRDVANTGDAVYLGNRAAWVARFGEETSDSSGEGAWAALPLIVNGRLRGALTVRLSTPRDFDDEERAFMRAFADMCAQGLERVRLYESERAARSRAEALQRVTSALIRLESVEEIGAFMSREVSMVIGAKLCWAGRLAADGRLIETIASYGVKNETAHRWNRFAIDAPMPLAKALRTRQALWFADKAELLEEFPSYVETAEDIGREGAAIIPLIIGDGDDARRIGGLSFGFGGRHTFDETTRAFVLALAQQCAQALDRAHLHEAQISAARRMAFLADASRALALPLDADEVLRVLASLPMPEYADYTMVYRVGSDGFVHRVARAHIHLAGAAVLDRLEHEYPLSIESEVPAARVLRTHTTLFLPEMHVRMLSDVGPGAGYTEIVGALGPCSGIIVPLVARGRALGALVLAMAREERGGSGRRFSRDDVALAESLAERASLALDALLILKDAERARQDAEEANRAKSEFLTTMSHELRTPLNAIAGHVQLIDMALHGPVTPAQRDALARVDRAQGRLTALINDILNFARLEAGRVTYDIRETNVRHVIAEVTDLMEPQFTARSLSVNIEIPETAEGAPIPVAADAEKLAQVLLNLVSNAVKFTSIGGHVAIEFDTDTDPAWAQIRVLDDGVGIPTDKLQAVFEPFVQLGRGLKSTIEGTGLGLAISRDLVRGMGGELTVKSEAGKGSALTIQLRRYETELGSESSTQI